MATTAREYMPDAREGDVNNLVVENGDGVLCIERTAGGYALMDYNAYTPVDADEDLVAIVERWLSDVWTPAPVASLPVVLSDEVTG